MDFMRVRLECPGLSAAPFLELYAVREGQAGSRLISACATPHLVYTTMLVDRGFVADDVTARPPVEAAETAPIEIVGVLRSPEAGNLLSPPNLVERWFTRDVAGMAVALDSSRAAPVFLMAETSTNPQWEALVPPPIPANIANNHLGYAITWYGLAGALMGVYAAVLIRRWKP